MIESSLWALVALPLLFGLIGFVEPCSIGTTLLMIKQVEGLGAGRRFVQLLIFAATRALFIGLLGVVAAFAGTAFLGFQRTAWGLLGALYLTFGIMYASGHASRLMHGIGPRLNQLRGRRGAVLLGLLFGLNIPAWAAPLILALLGLAAAAGASTADLGRGFISLAVFGLALSLPLVAAVLSASARRLLDRLAALSNSMPRWTGAIFIALGLWSIWFALFVPLVETT